MSISLTNLSIHRLVVSLIHGRSSTDQVVPPVLGKHIEVLDQKAKDALTGRLTDALGHGSKSMDMMFRDRSDSSAHALSLKMLGSDEAEFIACAGQASTMLTNAQYSRRIPGGLLLVFQGSVGSGNDGCVGFLKAEGQTGFSKQDTADGPVLTFLQDLYLTPHQKLYKVGLVVATKKSNPAHLEVRVFDHNVASDEQRVAAKYFYDTFLGCEYVKTSKKLTKDFYDLTRDFIDEHIEDQVERYDYYNALVVELRVSKNQSLSTAKFAEAFMPKDLVDDYVSYMCDSGVPETDFHKDTSLIKYKLRRRSVSFSSGVKITAPMDGDDGLFKIGEPVEGYTRVDVKGEIQTMGR